jgi:hypothetical protein
MLGRKKGDLAPTRESLLTLRFDSGPKKIYILTFGPNNRGKKKLPPKA